MWRRGGVAKGDEAVSRARTYAEDLVVGNATVRSGHQQIVESLICVGDRSASPARAYSPL